MISRQFITGVTVPTAAHRFLYAAGDPVNLIDPRGLATISEYWIKIEAMIPAVATIRYALLKAGNIKCLVVLFDLLGCPLDDFACMSRVLTNTNACIFRAN